MDRPHTQAHELSADMAVDLQSQLADPSSSLRRSTLGPQLLSILLEDGEKIRNFETVHDSCKEESDPVTLEKKARHFQNHSHPIRLLGIGTAIKATPAPEEDQPTWYTAENIGLAIVLPCGIAAVILLALIVIVIRRSVSSISFF